MNKLTRIQSLVDTHFAAKEDLEKLFTDDHAAWVADSSYNPKLDTAMTLLRDLLPMLEALVKLYPIVPPYPDNTTIDYLGQVIETEVWDLLQEVQP